MCPALNKFNQNNRFFFFGSCCTILNQKNINREKSLWNELTEKSVIFQQDNISLHIQSFFNHMQAAFVGTVPLFFLKDAKTFPLTGFESLDSKGFDWNENVMIIFYLFYEQRYFGISQTCNMKELSFT